MIKNTRKILKTILNLCTLKSKMDEKSQKMLNVAFGTMVTIPLSFSCIACVNTDHLFNKQVIKHTVH